MANIQCTYDYYEYKVVGNIYHCDVKHEVTVNSRDEAVSISGSHQDGKNNDDVYGIYVHSNVYYFPRGLEKYFKNFKMIYVGAHLKEIRQVDLKPFTMLKELHLVGTIETLEDGLFDYNLDLELIFIAENKISHIGSNVFDKLTKLSSLYLDLNTCINMKAYYDKTGVQDVIRTAKAKCAN